MFSKLFSLSRDRQNPRRKSSRGSRARNPQRVVLWCERLERRLTPCTVTIGNPTTVTNINNDDVVLNTHGGTSVEIFCNGVSKGTDTSHTINLTTTGGTNKFTLDDSAFGGNDTYSITTDASGHQQ